MLGGILLNKGQLLLLQAVLEIIKSFLGIAHVIGM